MITELARYYYLKGLCDLIYVDIPELIQGCSRADKTELVPMEWRRTTRRKWMRERLRA